MRWSGCFIRRAGGCAISVAVVLAAGMLQGCVLAGPGAPPQAISDSEMTAETFDDTIAFEPADDADEAVPPLEVHELDPGKAAAADGKKVVDGKDWLQADDFERNDILNLVAETQPADSILVIVVATGDIWQIPLAEGQPLPDGVRPWYLDEYDMLAEDDRPRDGDGPLTRDQFEGATSVAGSSELARILYLHTFGPMGFRDIKDRQGFQVALAATWLRETPIQRALRLLMLQKVLQRLPQFQGAGNQLAFALMVPGGSLYGMPESAYLRLTGQRLLQAWMAYEIIGLPVVQLLLDRAIKNTRIIDVPIP